MSHHYKISTETYLKIFQYIEENNCSVSMAVRALDVDVSSYWAMKKYKAYQKDGIEAIQARSPRAYSNDLKLQVVNEALSSDISLQELATKYSIRSAQSIRLWIKRYQAGKELKSYDFDSGGDRLAKQTTLEERVMIAQYCIENDKDYRETARVFHVTYNQVHRWVKRYEAYGEDGLIDGRGRGKPEILLTDIEKTELEMKVLKKQNEFLRMENEVLKKEREIESELMNQALSTKRHTKR